eukprot:TRINITY_DN7237_c0_g1_i1.p1 TRINITY_DN7237_c0_g1~~TRINITY_DN7237_c0_g1_i1.p1  ORF type:complete len:750 (+),score=205.92 TRINITY_DN7237_c0_g1_i1:327-2252(+)
MLSALPPNLMRQWALSAAMPALSRNKARATPPRRRASLGQRAASTADTADVRCVRWLGPFVFEGVPQETLPQLRKSTAGGVEVDWYVLPPRRELASLAAAGVRLRGALSAPAPVRGPGSPRGGWPSAPPQAASMRWAHPVADAATIGLLEDPSQPAVSFARSGGVLWLDSAGAPIRAAALKHRNTSGSASQSDCDLRFNGPFRWRAPFATPAASETRFVRCHSPELRRRGVRYIRFLGPGEVLTAASHTDTWTDWVHGGVALLFRHPSSAAAGSDCYFRISCPAASCKQCRDERRQQEAAMFAELLTSGATPWAGTPTHAATPSRANRQSSSVVLGSLGLVSLPADTLPALLPASVDALRRYALPPRGPFECLPGLGLAAVGAASPPHSVSDGVLCVLPVAPPSATSYLFAHPIDDADRLPGGMATPPSAAPAAQFAQNGGFVFLDGLGSVCGGAALTPAQDGADGRLQLMGPFQWRSECTQPLHQGSGATAFARFRPVGAEVRLLVPAAQYACWLSADETVPVPRRRLTTASMLGESLSSPAPASDWSDWPHGAVVVLCHDPDDLPLPGDAYFRVCCDSADCSGCASAARRLSILAAADSSYSQNAARLSTCAGSSPRRTASVRRLSMAPVVSVRAAAED